MTVRKQADLLGHEVVGKLVRHPEWENNSHERVYIDQAGNEYYTRRGILTIVTYDGGVI